MLCDICKKEEACIHIEKHDSGEKGTYHICQTCADLQGFTPQKLQDSKVLEKLFRHLEKALKVTLGPDKNSSCPTCKTTLSTFQQEGLLGCTDCYTTFHGQLVKDMQQLHPSLKHLGKLPKQNLELNFQEKADLLADDLVDSPIEELERKLQYCINEEDYESAAEIRDQIAGIK